MRGAKPWTPHQRRHRHLQPHHLHYSFIREYDPSPLSLSTIQTATLLQPSHKPQSTCPMAAVPDEAKELRLVNSVELKIALADSDSKLQKLLNLYLPPLLMKLGSPHASVRNKVRFRIIWSYCHAGCVGYNLLTTAGRRSMFAHQHAYKTLWPAPTCTGASRAVQRPRRRWHLPPHSEFRPDVHHDRNRPHARFRATGAPACVG